MGHMSYELIVEREGATGKEGGDVLGLPHEHKKEQTNRRNVLSVGPLSN